MTETWQKSACILCECNCGLEVQVQDRHLIKIRGDKDHPSSQGYTCEKPLRLDKYQNGPHRITTPMRKRPDGSHETISWETAFDEIAERLMHVVEEYGGDKIFFYGGGGQGNHLGAAYGRGLQAALGVKYFSNALAQEKTGEMWVDGKLYGGHTKGDFEHAEVVLFLGKNPWQSHSFPRARPTLREIARDPERSMIVIDPRRSETAELADFHLQVKPGTDAWCLSAMLGVIVQEDLVDHDFLARHTDAGEELAAHFNDIDVAAYSASCGVPEKLIREASRRFATAKSATTYEDLGTQQSLHSTLVSYLNKMLWILTGNFGRRGTMYLHSMFAAVAGSSAGGSGGGRIRTTPVTGARIISGLVPANSIAEEINTDHPDRFRAMWMDSTNPAHSLADSPSFKKAMAALDLTVVVDVAMTETARLADYVLPASSQFEKWECTFFNVEFPHNAFQLRPPLMEPLEGTLAEPEIYAQIIRRLGVVPAETLTTLKEAAAHGRDAFTQAFFTLMLSDPSAMGLAPYLLHETMGDLVPHGTAAIWGLAQICQMTYPASVARAGFADGNALFDALIAHPEGVNFTVDEWDDVWTYVRRPDQRFTVLIPELLAELPKLDTAPPQLTSTEYPFVLSAGERRAFTANTIYRDPEWRRRDPGGALRISEADAANLGVADGATIRIVTAGGSAEVPIEISPMMQAGHISLPNGYGVDHPEAGKVGVAPNSLTWTDHRDEFAGTPWHKHVPARLELV